MREQPLGWSRLKRPKMPKILMKIAIKFILFIVYYKT